MAVLLQGGIGLGWTFYYPAHTGLTDHASFGFALGGLIWLALCFVLAMRVLEAE